MLFKAAHGQKEKVCKNLLCPFTLTPLLKEFYNRYGVNRFVSLTEIVVG